MKKIFIFLILSGLSTSCKKNEPQNIDAAYTTKKELLLQMDSLSASLKDYENLLQQTTDTIKIKEAFVTSRKLFKHIEWATEYFLPKSSRSINGPALDMLDLDENKFLPAEGFQVLEEYLYPSVQLNEKEEMIRQVKIIENLIRTGKTNIEVSEISDAHIFDALRLQLFKITALGIAGFDTPVSNLLFVESAESLKSIRSVVNHFTFTSDENGLALQRLLTEAIVICEKNPDKNSFDYLTFITSYLDPISKTLYTLQKEAGIDFIKRSSVVPSTTASLFQENAFDVNSFTPSEKYYISDAKIALGKEMFYDTHLSKNNARSCASCHQPEKAFTDGLKTALDLNGKPLQRNTPSLNYASFYHGQFWDMRQMDIESLSVSVIENKDEMHGNMEDIVKKLNNDSAYKEKFKKVFPEETKIETWQLQNVLASYIRSLSVFSSRFDDYMRGKTNALNAEEKKGFNIFMGKAKCATCHFLPFFNGTVPPRFTSSEQEVLGIPADKTNRRLDTDPGRQLYNMDLLQLKNAFKTATVRNIDKTAPYMHNGVYTTLEEVVEFYNQGGGLGFGLPVENQTLPEDKLHLTPEESKALIAFMRALNDQ